MRDIVKPFLSTFISERHLVDGIVVAGEIPAA